MSSAQQKPSFSSKLGVLLTVMGSAVGVGNMIFFPSIVKQSGGAVFLLVYLIFVIILGYPLLISELALGRSKRRGPYQVYKAYKGWSWLSGFSTFFCFVIYAFYNVFTGWIGIYLWKLVNGSLLQVTNYTEVWKEVRLSAGTSILFTFIFLLVNGWISDRGVKGGLEKLSYFLMPIFLVILTVLIGYTLTFENAAQGLYVYLYPNFGEFWAQGWRKLLPALGQSFMSLSLGAGLLTTYGAYIDKKENLRQISALIAFGDTVIAFAAGLFLAPIIFTGSVKESGFELAFVALPKIFLEMGPVVGFFVGFSFYILLIFAGLTSSIALLETPMRYVRDRFGYSRRGSVLLLTLLALPISVLTILGVADYPYLGNIGRYGNFMDFLIFICFNFGMPFGAFCVAIFVGYYWGIDRLVAEIYQDQKPDLWIVYYLQITIRYIIPLLVGSILLSSFL